MGKELVLPTTLPISDHRLMQYVGLWAIEEMHALALTQLFESIGDWGAHIEQFTQRQQARAAAGEDGPASRSYALAEGGIAVIRIVGTVMKQETSLGEGTSTVAVIRQLQKAAADPTIKGILQHVESPGGTVAGTAEWADAVAAAGRKKPVWTYGEDVIASAAFWGSVNSERIAVNRMVRAGSIGTYGVVKDLSKAAEQRGMKVHVIRAGAFKGMGTPGTEITAEQLAELQRQVNAMNDHFVAAVRSGRKLTGEQAAAVADGRTFTGDEALKFGLIDAVESFEATLAAMQSRLTGSKERTQKMSEENKGPVAATLAELKSAFPNASNDFVVGQLERSATIAQASTAWTQKLEADLKAANEKTVEANAKAEGALRAQAEAEEKLKTATTTAVKGKGTGVDPLRQASDDKADAGGDVEARVEALVAEELKDKRFSRAQALQRVFAKDDELREAYVADHNAKHPQHNGPSRRKAG